MISLNEIGKRFRAVWEIALGDKSKLRLLDTSSAGFKASFQAILVALIPSFLGWILIAQHIHAMPDDFNRTNILLKAAFIDLCRWIVPLMLIIAASGLFGIRDRIIPFVIAYNWGKAFLEWLGVPLIVLKLIFPHAYVFHWLFDNFLLVMSIYIIYRLFQAALDKTIGYMLPFIILYMIISASVLIISLEIVGWPVFSIRAG